MMSSNQAQVDETVFPFWNKEMIEKYQSDQATDILFRAESDVKWISYGSLHISNNTRVFLIMQVIWWSWVFIWNSTEVSLSTRVTQIIWLKDKLELSNVILDEQLAYIAGISHHTWKGPAQSVDPECLPKNHKDTGLRHIPRSIADSWKKMHSKFFA